MPTSPDLTGGTGFSFEDAVVASYLASTLAGGAARGLGECIADRVLVQREALGQPLDDVIVEGVNRFGHRARLSLQVKQSLTISSAATNRDFRDVVHRAWKTFIPSTFTLGRDRCGGATANIAGDSFRAVRATGEWARLATSEADFFARIAIPEFASNTQREYVNGLRALIAETGEAATDGQLWRFIQHFLVLRFDLRSEGAEDDAEAVERVRSVLGNDAPERAPELWTALLRLARDMAGAAGSIDRPTLLALLAPTFAFQPRVAAARDLTRLAEEAEHALADIRRDIGGLTFARPFLLDAVRARLATHRVVHVTGEPGSGKSVLLRMLADAQRGEGFAFVLKADRLTGPTWAAYAAHHRLQTDRLQDLLAELAVSGEPVIYIDGLDRVPKESQGTVRDILRTVLTTPALDRWRVVATLRDGNIEHIRTWLRPELFAPGIVHTFAVPSFTEPEARQIADALPHLRPLLFGDEAVREIARRPFFLGVLAQPHRTSADHLPATTEVEILRAWWRGGGYEADSSSVRRRQEALLRLAEHGNHLWGEGTSAGGVDAAVLQGLIEDGVLREDLDTRHLWFRHDIFFEWSFFFAARSRVTAWLDVIRAAGEPPALGRVVELLSQSALEERGDAWVAELGRLEVAEARSQWNRAWLLAPFSSPRFPEFRETITAAVLAQPDTRLAKLFVWFPAVRTVDNPRILSGEHAIPDLNTFETLLFADLLAWPQEYSAWMRFVGWLLTVEERLSGKQVGDAMRVVEVWLNAFEGSDDRLTRGVAERLRQWLTELEDGPPNVTHGALRSEPGDAATRPYRWDRDTATGLESRIRKAFVRAALGFPSLLGQYLERLIALPNVRRDAFSDLVTQAGRLAQVTPTPLVDICLKEFRAPLRSEIVNRRPTGIFGSSYTHDMEWDHPGLAYQRGDFLPPSPVREPFRSLLQHAPAEGLRLIRELLAHVMAAWREMHQYDRPPRVTPLPLTLTFPWGEETYWGDVRVHSWYRGGRGDALLVSALMALEDWAFGELERGRDVDAVIQEVVSGNTCVATLGIAVGLALQANRVSMTTLPLATCQRLWEYDIQRFVQLDRSGMHPSEFAAGMFGADPVHVPELRRTNHRPVRQREIRELAMMFTLGADDPLRKRFTDALARFPEKLPFEYAEEASDEAHVNYLRRSAEGWAAMADREHYRAVPSPDGTGAHVYFENPRAATPEVRQVVEQQAVVGRWLRPLNFAHEALKPGAVVPVMQSVREMIELARANDTADLFDRPLGLGSLEQMRRSGVAGTAAVVLTVAPSPTAEEVNWAEGVVRRASRVPASPEDRGRDDDHPAVYASKGLAGLLRRHGGGKAAKRELLTLALHPIPSVSLAAIAQAMGCWQQDPRFAWSVFRLALELSVGERPPSRGSHILIGPDGPEFEDEDEDDPQDDVQGYDEHGDLVAPRDAGPSTAVDFAESRINAVIERAVDDAGHFTLPSPPPPWRLRDAGDEPPMTVGDATGEANRGSDGAATDIFAFEEPRRYLKTDWLLAVLSAVPLEFVLADAPHRAPFLRLMDECLAWTIERNAPSWHPHRPSHRDRIRTPIKWNSGFLQRVAVVGAHAGVDWVRDFLAPLDAVPPRPRVELLRPFVSLYVAVAVVDMPSLEPAVVDLVANLVDKVADDPAWADVRRDPLRDRGGEGVRAIRSVLLADWDGNAKGAARFANGDWRDVLQMAPAVNRALELLGDVPEVLSAFLTHVEKGYASYNLAAFMSQLRRIPPDVWTSRTRWANHNAARLAALIQRFVEREQPLAAPLHGEVLAILDRLVDVGDRRSAALQVSELLRPRRPSGS